MQSYKHTIVDGDEIAKWWPNQLNLKILTQNNPRLTPATSEFSYKKAFGHSPMKNSKKILFRL
ncbi:hypothetical protein [Sulfurimonas sp. NW9]|uniref:hypothetical protein n=1 Tax=Sulfurimonas sp. NW9 TaxID=2922728 RepID=UPI003DA9DC9F